MNDKSCLNHQPIGLIPIYHWRGAMPWLLELDSSQAGWVVTLLFGRQGECCLLPVAWLHDELGWDDDRLPPGYTHPNFAADALDDDLLKLALAELEGEGWEVRGRLELHFTGRLAEMEFWPHLQSYLWQRPRHGESNGD